MYVCFLNNFKLKIIIFLKYKIALFFCFVSCFIIYSQEKEAKFSNLEIDYFYGNILRHNNSVGNLILDHPTGFIISYNRKTTGNKEWQHRYDYPDFGISFSYQDFKKIIL